MKVLLVDDSPVYQRLVANSLREWGFDCTICNDGMEAWKLLQYPTSPRLILLDWVMPKMDGVELCRRLRDARGPEHTYKILFTAKDGRDNFLKALEAGADDYLVKPFDELQLKVRLLLGQRILELQAQLAATRDSMRQATTHDPLTGAANRGEVLSCLRRELDRCRREHKPVGIILVDVDQFKKVNDELGPLFGDEALKELARRFRSKLRVYDTVGRYGGEEFLLLLPGCDLTTTIIRADEIRAYVCASPVMAFTKRRTLTASMGVAVSDGSGVVTLETLLEQADLSLHQAKSKGRNRVEHIDFETSASAASNRSNQSD